MATLLQYAFTAGTDAATTTASGLSGSVVTNVGCSYFDHNGDDGWASAPVLICNPATDAISAATAVSTGSYWYFTATADAGQFLNLATLTLNAGRGGASTPRGIKVRSSIDSYAADLYSADLDTATPTWTAVNIDLSGAAFQVLSAITFRIYIWAPTTSNSVDEDDITLTGTVASTTSLNIGDAWKAIDWTGSKLNVGDVWKESRTVKVNIGDAWKRVYSSPAVLNEDATYILLESGTDNRIEVE